MESLMTKYYFAHIFSAFDSFIMGYDVTVKHFKAKDLVSSQVNTLNHGYYIRDGIMKLSIGSECGKEKILALFGPGSIFPLGINEHHYNLEYAITEQAFTDLDVVEFTFSELRAMFCDNQDLALKMMEHYCDFSSFLFYEISSLTNDSSFRKTCNIIYEMSGIEFFDDDCIRIGQTDIADFGGMSKVQVARAYQVLKERGILETKRNGFIVKDRQALFDLCSQDFIDYSSDLF